MAKYTLDSPWHDNRVFAGVHTHFTVRHCIECLCADVIDNYDTEIIGNHLFIRSREGNSDLYFTVEMMDYLNKRLEYHRYIRSSVPMYSTQGYLHRLIPEYQDALIALHDDQPETFRAFDKNKPFG